VIQVSFDHSPDHLGVNYRPSRPHPRATEAARSQNGTIVFWSKLFSRWGRKERPADAGLRIPKHSGQDPAQRLDKRRGPRLAASLPVFIYGRLEGQPFSEHAETANVSPQGGLLEVSCDIERAHPVLITNLRTNEELACRVARVIKSSTGKTLVGLEFLRPSPNFWSVDFSLNAHR
jgi:hypothetical protein